MEITTALKVANLAERLAEASAKMNELRQLYDDNLPYTVIVNRADGSALLRMHYAPGEQSATVTEMLLNFQHTIQQIKIEIEKL